MLVRKKRAELRARDHERMGTMQNIPVVKLGLIAVSFLDPTALEGLLPEVMTALSLFERFTPFVSGVFDLTSAVCYLTVIGVFLFLSVQSMEKRRYN